MLRARHAVACKADPVIRKVSEMNRSQRAAASAPPDRTSSRSKGLNLLLKLGPGLITGGSVVDPGGIGTYSQVGAQFGYGMLWTTLFSYPLMVVIQEISARIGRTTGIGIAGNIRKHYPKTLLYGVVLLLLIANIFNLAADLGAMGASAKLLLPGPVWIYTLLFGVVSLFFQMFVPYTRYVKYLKWLTVALFAYVATSIVVGEPRWAALRATFLPSLSFRGAYFTALIEIGRASCRESV